VAMLSPQAWLTLATLRHFPGALEATPVRGSTQEKPAALKTREREREEQHVRSCTKIDKRIDRTYQGLRLVKPPHSASWQVPVGPGTPAAVRHCQGAAHCWLVKPPQTPPRGTAAGTVAATNDHGQRDREKTHAKSTNTT
jgi:hypothetical protein